MKRWLGLLLVAASLPLALSTGNVADAASVLVVNSTGDGTDAVLDGVCQTSTPGQCTLRAALSEANAITSGRVTINFDIPGSGVRTIRVLTRLPLIDNGSAGVTIDGFSQPGSRPNSDPLVDNGVRLVEVVGNGPKAEPQSHLRKSPAHAQPEPAGPNDAKAPHQPRPTEVDGASPTPRYGPRRPICRAARRASGPRLRRRSA